MNTDPNPTPQLDNDSTRYRWATERRDGSRLPYSPKWLHPYGTDRFVLCLDCGSLVLASLTDKHDGAVHG